MYAEGSITSHENGKREAALSGLRRWHGSRCVSVNLGYLHGSATRVERQYAETSRKGRGLANDYAEVGLGGSTLSGISLGLFNLNLIRFSPLFFP